MQAKCRPLYNAITIPNSVTSIGNDAFCDCGSLTNITIPNSVTSIGDSVFYGCSLLTNITIPNSLQSIGNSAFGGCDSLKYNEYDNGLYLGNENNPYVCLIKPKSWDITTCEINNATKFICDGALLGCSSLTSITIPNSVTSIGWGAFDYCRSLTSVTFKNTNGWSAGNSSGDTAISSSDLSNTSTAAKYLRLTYYNYNWKRS